MGRLAPSSDGDKRAHRKTTSISSIMDTCDCGLNHALTQPHAMKKYGPEHPDKMTLETRTESFKECGDTIKDKATELAAAGFFFVGQPDKAVCFYCGLGLHHWDPQDDPWREHALHSPRCAHVAKTRGYDFIMQTLSTREDVSPAQWQA